MKVEVSISKVRKQIGKSTMIITPKKGKGAYCRKQKHNKKLEW